VFASACASEIKKEKGRTRLKGSGSMYLDPIEVREAVGGEVELAKEPQLADALETRHQVVVHVEGKKRR
jgi:hypothetical protein